MINGKMYGWEDVTVLFPSGVSCTLKDISYNDEKEAEPVYGKGSNAVGYGRGNYKASGSFSLLKDEQFQFELAIKALSLNGKLYDHKPFPIVVSYADEGSPTSVTNLPACLITKRDNSAKQGDKEFVVKYDFICIEPIKSTSGDAN